MLFRSEIEEQVRIYHEHLKAAQSRQKSYLDHQQDVRFEVGEQAYLRVTPLKGVHRSVMKGKLAPRYAGPFPVLANCGKLAYQLNLPSSFPEVHDIFHVSQLHHRFKDPIRGVDHETLDLKDDLTYQESPVRILGAIEQEVRCQVIQFLKVQWSHHSEEDRKSVV